MARAALLSRMPDSGRSLEQLRAEVQRGGARFDGRLRIAAVDKGRGKRVMFAAPGAPRAAVAEAVEASCSIPWVFRPVRIGDREYVDGGVWSVVNLAAAPPGRGTHAPCPAGRAVRVRAAGGVVGRRLEGVRAAAPGPAGGGGGRGDRPAPPRRR